MVKMSRTRRFIPTTSPPRFSHAPPISSHILRRSNPATSSRPSCRPEPRGWNIRPHSGDVYSVTVVGAEKEDST